MTPPATATSDIPPAPGWYRDPSGGDGLRWWTGCDWDPATRPRVGLVPVTVISHGPPASPWIAIVGGMLVLVNLLDLPMGLVGMVGSGFGHHPEVGAAFGHLMIASQFGVIAAVVAAVGRTIRNDLRIAIMTPAWVIPLACWLMIITAPGFGATH